jgi:SlyX protein
MSKPDKDTQARMDELESRLAFQDDLIENLNEVISRQDREILNLVQKLKELDGRINDLAASAAAPGGSMEQEVPPHY